MFLGQERQTIRVILIYRLVLGYPVGCKDQQWCKLTVFTWSLPAAWRQLFSDFAMKHFFGCLDPCFIQIRRHLFSRCNAALVCFNSIRKGCIPSGSSGFLFMTRGMWGIFVFLSPRYASTSIYNCYPSIYISTTRECWLLPSQYAWMIDRRHSSVKPWADLLFFDYD